MRLKLSTEQSGNPPPISFLLWVLTMRLSRNQPSSVEILRRFHFSTRDAHNAAESEKFFCRWNNLAFEKI
jgi:hypothetical protein